MKIPLPRRIKSLTKRLLSAPGINLLAARHAGLSTCLNYHRITADVYGPESFNPNIYLSVHVGAFEEQIRYLSENYLCLTVPDAVRLLRVGKLPSGSVTITFDDGYRDNLTLALPILEKYGVPATVFITTGFLDRSAALWWEEQAFILERISSLKFEWQDKQFNWELTSRKQKEEAAAELRTTFKRLNSGSQNELMDLLRSACSERFSYDSEVLTYSELCTLDQHPLITIGAHTLTHPVLSRVSKEQVRHELLGSRSILEQILGHPVDLFAYPIGGKDHASVREFQLAEECGFVAALTSRPGHFQSGHRDYPFSLPRIPVDYFDTLQSLRWKLSGYEAVVQQRGRRFITD